MKQNFIKPVNPKCLQGRFITSHPNIEDNRFNKTVIYITEHTSSGSTGLVINKKSAYTFSSLIKHLSSSVSDSDELKSKNSEVKVLRGGPVDIDKLFILHSPDYKSNSTVVIDNNICYTDNIEILGDYLKNKGPQKLSIFIGNCTWSNSQLEEEIKNDVWLISDNQFKDSLFDQDCDKLWRDVYYSMGITNTNSSYFYTSHEKTLQ